MRYGKKKLKLSISGSSKKTINNIEQAKSQSKNSVIIEKNQDIWKKTFFKKTKHKINFQPKQNLKFKQESFV